MIKPELGAINLLDHIQKEDLDETKALYTTKDLIERVKRHSNTEKLKLKDFETAPEKVKKSIKSLCSKLSCESTGYDFNDYSIRLILKCILEKKL